jgi:acid stress chaperone HdeA
MKESASPIRSFAVAALAGLLALGVGSVAYAAKKVKPREMTCEEFLALGSEVQPRVVYWLEGYSKSGKLEDAEVDVDSMQRPVAMVVTECRKEPKATLWQKLEDAL